MIQYVCFNPDEMDASLKINKKMELQEISRPVSFDQYEINIIDLNNESIWANTKTGRTDDGGDYVNDMVSLGQIIDNSQSSNIVIVFPQNLGFKTVIYGNAKTTLLKDMLKEMYQYFLSRLIPEYISFEIGYEISNTTIENSVFESDFYFKKYNCQKIHTSKGNNCTTIQNRQIYLTTLKIENFKDIELIIKDLDLVKEKASIPEWMESIHMLDDEIQRESISQFNQEIKKIEEKREEAERKLAQNNRYKSILYTNSDELVEVVFEILEKLLGCDFSKFEDKHKEDFSIEIGKKIFIGEIKGISSSVRRDNVSQLENHYQSYLDDHECNEKNLKALLIINPQRKLPLNVRSKIDDNQKNLAKRYGSLIITTHTLLKLFEKFEAEEISSEKCQNLLFDESGLLEIS